MRKNHIIFAASYLLAQASFGQVTPCDIQVINRGFEDPVLADEQYSYFIPGWIVMGDAGAFNPDQKSYPGGLVVDGSNCGYVSCCAGGRTPGIMTQTFPTLLTPNTTYELALDIGQRLETPWANFRLQLIGGSTVLIDSLIDTPPMPGTFDKRIFQFNCPPLHPAAGTRLQIRMSHEGAIEHQANFDALVLTAQSNCVSICTQPAPVQTCHGVTTVFKAMHSGVGPFTYKWSKDNVELTDGYTEWGSIIVGADTHYLTIYNVHTPDDGAYALTIANDCGEMKTQDATLLVCPADFNCDATVDFFDYLDFVDAFAMNVIAADWNEDGTIDFFDYLDFVDRYATGC